MPDRVEEELQGPESSELMMQEQMEQRRAAWAVGAAKAAAEQAAFCVPAEQEEAQPAAEQAVVAWPLGLTQAALHQVEQERQQQEQQQHKLQQQQHMKWLQRQAPEQPMQTPAFGMAQAAEAQVVEVMQPAAEQAQTSAFCVPEEPAKVQVEEPAKVQVEEVQPATTHSQPHQRKWVYSYISVANIPPEQAQPAAEQAQAVEAQVAEDLPAAGQAQAVEVQVAEASPVAGQAQTSAFSVLAEQEEAQLAAERAQQVELVKAVEAQAVEAQNSAFRAAADESALVLASQQQAQQQELVTTTMVQSSSASSNTSIVHLDARFAGLCLWEVPPCGPVAHAPGDDELARHVVRPLTKGAPRVDGSLVRHAAVFISGYVRMWSSS
ncbi:MAG: hypothetical protein GY772_31925 [bacterium]|nr:hypothetical protein [bacterium]